MLFFLLVFILFVQHYGQLLLCLSVLNKYKYKYLREDVFHYCKLMLLNRETKLYIFKMSITSSAL